MSTRKEARDAGRTRYKGKVCIRHPELEGQRMTSNAACTLCLKEKTVPRVAEYNRRQSEKRREDRWNAFMPPGTF